MGVTDEFGRTVHQRDLTGLSAMFLYGTLTVEVRGPERIVRRSCRVLIQLSSPKYLLQAESATRGLTGIFGRRCYLLQRWRPDVMFLNS